ncbi:MAG: NUDIX domain-containing protein [Flavobacteriaceae bacterium]|nr:NUDIX domain-containing protein [Flavobacteriaceae bacterium]
MDEYIDLVDSSGNSLGRKALKSEAHRNGWYHNTIHLWLYSSKGEILLSQRSAEKLIFPLLWDVSAAGHVDAGETIIDAAVRETQEELGLVLTPTDLNFLGVFKHESFYHDGAIKDFEFHHAFITELKINTADLKLQKGEVDAIKLVGQEEFLNLLDKSPGNSHFVPSNIDYYKLILERVGFAVKN